MNDPQSEPHKDMNQSVRDSDVQQEANANPAGDNNSPIPDNTQTSDQQNNPQEAIESNPIVADNAETTDPLNHEANEQAGSNHDLTFCCSDEYCHCMDSFCTRGSYCIMGTCFKFFENSTCFKSENTDASLDSEDDDPDAITEEELAKLKIDYCAKGNCPCGDGFCSEGSYCIIDTCICGAHPDDGGYFDSNTIASNNYGEFECVAYEFEEGCGKDVYHDLLCTRDKGCKTGDGEKYKKSINPFADDDPYSTYRDNDDLHIGYSDKDDDIDYYERLVRERYLIDNCGKKLPKNLEILDRGEGGDRSYRDPPTRPECDLRIACNDKSVTPEHIAEYVCDIGQEYYYECGTTHRDMPIGLRCNQTDGCACGDIRCPNHALCKEGTCVYDLYYQHRVCPGDDGDWEPSLDSYNYMKSLKGHIDCECIDNKFYEDVDGDEEVCYDWCYWDIYPSKMTRDDPCTANQAPQISEFEARKPFKFTITTDIANDKTDTDTSDTDKEKKYVRIPISIASNSVNDPVKYDVDCEGDGEYEQIDLTKDVKCVYTPNTGNHQIQIRGDISSMRLCSPESDAEDAVISVDSWGDIEWKTMHKFAAYCKTLNKIPNEAPNLSQVKDMSGMFRGAQSFNQPLENWNVSNVTNMSSLFEDAPSFNQPLEKWDVSNVTDMSYMFSNAYSFNQPLGKWNVSHVTNMSYMFGKLSDLSDNRSVSFNQPLESWDVSNVTNMSHMFDSAVSFNHPLERWDVSNVTDTSYMFNGAESFNQPLGKWNVSSVTDISGMFANAKKFNQPIDSWDVSKVTSLFWLFKGAQSFNQPLENWDVSNVTNMHGTFEAAFAFNQPIEKWNVSKVENMSDMFSYAKSFNQPIGAWNVSNVRVMNQMFDGATSFNQPLNTWNVSNVEYMVSMFRHARAFNQPLDKWKMPKVTDMNYVFEDAQSFNQPLENWNVSNVESMGGMFSGAKSFNQPLDKWNVSKVTYMRGMFEGASSFSHYPQSWVVPQEYSYDMFKNTPLEQVAKEQPLKKEERD